MLLLLECLTDVLT